MAEDSNPGQGCGCGCFGCTVGCLAGIALSVMAVAGLIFLAPGIAAWGMGKAGAAATQLLTEQTRAPLELPGFQDDPGRRSQVLAGLRGAPEAESGERVVEVSEGDLNLLMRAWIRGATGAPRPPALEDAHVQLQAGAARVRASLRGEEAAALLTDFGGDWGGTLGGVVASVRYLNLDARLSVSVANGIPRISVRSASLMGVAVPGQVAEAALQGAAPGLAGLVTSALVGPGNTLLGVDLTPGTLRLRSAPSVPAPAGVDPGAPGTL